MSAAGRLALVGLVACGPKRVEVAYPVTVPPTLKDADAHLLWQTGRSPIGRFSGEPGTVLDERDGLGETACGAFLAIETTAPAVPEGGWIDAGPEASARAGGSGAPGAHAVWADVVPGPGQRARIADRNGLAACCAEHPEACAPWYVSEVWSGSGTFYHPAARPDGTLGWTAGTMVTAAPYAFAVSSNPYATADCGSWQLELPVAVDGVYALGVSNATFAERNAIRDAVDRNRESAVVELRRRGVSDTRVDGLVEERRCVDVFPGAGGDQYIVQILSFIPVTP